jgi:hypothetical protein
MYTSVPKPTLTLTHSCYPLLYMYPSNHFLPLKQSSCNLPRYLNLEKSQLKNFASTGDWTRVCNSQSCLWCIYCWIALMQTWNQRLVALEGLGPYPLRFHVEEAGADAKLNQHGPLGVAYHRRHPISTVPVARITAHATVPGLNLLHWFSLANCPKHNWSSFQCMIYWRVYHFPFRDQKVRSPLISGG